MTLTVEQPQTHLPDSILRFWPAFLDPSQPLDRVLAGFEELKARFEPVKAYAFDTETQGALGDNSRKAALNIKGNELVGLSLCWKEQSYLPWSDGISGMRIPMHQDGPFYPSIYIPIKHALVPDLPPVVLDWIRDILKSEKVKIIHQIPFDEPVVFHRHGWVITKPKIDTMLQAWIYDETAAKALKTLMEELLPGWKSLEYGDLAKTPFGSIPPAVAYPYACQDAYGAYRVFEFYRKETYPKGVDLLLNLEMPIQEEFMQMHYEGIDIDVHLLRVYLVAVKEILEKLQEKINEAFGQKVNLNSPVQLKKAFHNLGVPLTDVQALTLKRTKHELADLVLAWKLYDRIRSTYLESLEKTIWPDGKIHPIFKQWYFDEAKKKGSGTKTGRSSCIAKGTMIEGPRDVSEYPNGTPIEDIKVGDLVYSYDDSGDLKMRRVLASGQTGVERTIGVRWVSTGHQGGNGILYLTPEHEVRMLDGTWRRAADLKPKDRLMALSRGDNNGYCRLWARHKREIREHRFIMDQLGYDVKHKHVHHKNENKQDNRVENLGVMTHVEHARYHMSLLSTEEKRRRGEIFNRPDVRAKAKENTLRGKDSPQYKHISKTAILRMFAKCGGRIVDVIRTFNIDFETINSKCVEHGFDYRGIRLRYGADRRYISRGRLARALVVARDPHEIRREVKTNWYNVKNLCEYFGLTPRNHEVVELVDGPVVPVYDLTIEETKCFIADQIAVHNSSGPNVQNVFREPTPFEACVLALDLSEATRSLMITVKGEQVHGINLRDMWITPDGEEFVKCDASQLEPRCAAAITGEPLLMEAFNNGQSVYKRVGIEAMRNAGHDVDDIVKGSAEYHAFKTVVLGLSYGAGPGKEKDTLEEEGVFMSLEEVTQVHNWVTGILPQVTTIFPEIVADELMRQGYVETVFGRRRRFPKFHRKDRGMRRQAVNFKMGQSPGFDIIKRAILMASAKIKEQGLKARMIGQIHDEIIVRSPKTERAAVARILYDSVTDPSHMGFFPHPVPLDAEVATGTRYGSLTVYDMKADDTPPWVEVMVDGIVRDTHEVAGFRYVTAPCAIEPELIAAPTDGKQAYLNLLKDVLPCQKCAFFQPYGWHKVGLQGTVTKPVTLAWVGANPGDEDVEARMPMMGRAGLMLRQTAYQHGLPTPPQADCVMLPALWCHSPHTDGITGREIKNCRGYLDQMLAVCRPKVIIAMGSVAMRAVLRINEEAVEPRLGWHDLPTGSRVYITYSPAFILKSRGYKPDFDRHLSEVREYLNGVGR